MPPWNMPLGDHKAVAPGKGIDVKDAKRQIVLVDFMRRRKARNDVAKDAAFLVFFALLGHTGMLFLKVLVFNVFFLTPTFNKEGCEVPGVIWHVI
jgi:hypothetical protein